MHFDYQSGNDKLRQFFIYLAVMDIAILQFLYAAMYVVLEMQKHNSMRDVSAPNCV